MSFTDLDRSALADRLVNTVIRNAMKANQKVSVSVVDSGGRTIVLKRMPGAPYGTVESALLKASTAVAYGKATILGEEKAERNHLTFPRTLDHVVLGGGVPVCIGESTAPQLGLGVCGATSKFDHDLAISSLEYEIKNLVAHSNDFVPEESASRLDLAGLHHIALLCSEYRRSKLFYVDILGFRVMDESYHEVQESWKAELVGAGGLRLSLLALSRSAARPKVITTPGLGYFALSSKDLASTYTNLLSAGVTCSQIQADAETKKKYFFCNDPDRIPIEFFEG
jgi:glyoxylase I family protein